MSGLLRPLVLVHNTPQLKLIRVHQIFGWPHPTPRIDPPFLSLMHIPLNLSVRAHMLVTTTIDINAATHLPEIQTSGYPLHTLCHYEFPASYVGPGSITRFSMLTNDSGRTKTYRTAFPSPSDPPMERLNSNKRHLQPRSCLASQARLRTIVLVRPED